MHERIGGYAIADIEFVMAVDTDARKVGKDLGEAIFAAPNCTTVFQEDVPATGVTVLMGRVLDGMAPHMERYGERGFVRADAPEADEADIVAALKASGAEILVNFLPVGSEEAIRFYMECALKAGVAVVNCMPVFIASDLAMGKALPREGAADRRRRHQGAIGRDHRPPRPFQPVPRPRRGDDEDLPAQHRRQYRFHEHARSRAGWNRRRN